MNDRLKKLEIAGWSLIGTSALLGITSIATGVVTYQLRQDEISELFKCHTPILTRKDCPEAFKIADKREKWEWITNGLAISAAANLIAGASILIARKIKIKKISDSFKKGSKIGMLDIRGILVQW